MNAYILDETDNPQRVSDSMIAYKWMEEHPQRKIVGLTRFPSGTRVSTVFLVLDHGWGERDKPVLWETMVFGGEEDSWQDRYTSYADAIEGHLQTVIRIAALESVPK